MVNKHSSTPGSAQPPNLDVIQESFEDIGSQVSRNSSLKINTTIGSHSLPHTNECVAMSSRDLSTGRLRSTSMENTYCCEKLSSPIGPNRPINSSNCVRRPLTSSQRYRSKLHKQKKLDDIEKEVARSPSELLSTLDSLSDDELPDDLIVFDVPFSKPLQSLCDHRASYQTSRLAQFRVVPKKRPIFPANQLQRTAQSQNVKFGLSRKKVISPQTPKTAIVHSVNPQEPHFSRLPPAGILQRPYSNISTGSNYSTGSVRSSPATRASSIFSFVSDMSELSLMDDEESSSMSFEGKLLNRNKDPHLDESLQRISMLKSLSRLSLSDSSLESVSDKNNKKVHPSKEKYDCLSVTRQLNLPPKDHAELAKHQQDYENLMQTQINKEKEKMKKYYEKQEILKHRNDYDYKIWKMICEKYDFLICLPSTRELWWRGIPRKQGLRASIWRRQLVGKKIKIDLTKFLKEAHIIIDKACDYKTTTSQLGQKKFEKENADRMHEIRHVEDYSKQIQKCFPDMIMFQLGSTFESVLSIAIAFDIAKTKEIYRLQLSVIETNRILRLICLLLKNLESEELAFHSLIDILLKKLPHTLLTMVDIPKSLKKELEEESNIRSEEMTYLKDIKDQFDRFLLTTSPNIYNHFVQHDMNTLIILQSTIATMFTNLLNMEVLERIFDIYIFEGDSFLLRCLLALIKKISYKLFGSAEETFHYLGDSSLDDLNSIDGKNILTGYEYLDVGEAEDFIRDVRKILRKNI